ncbi:hypothetical protein K4H28_07690 [Deefgea tanakiae]|uniref:Uncharacterized protein n=1 Tax=Deefgea tanakiae TaxID=2865840 RepID=A0ABX8Z9L9_9NEIS|nr:hypothetical protein [Deefgea tanakiae]QZA79266.1 hypothetical protein K4H28_07690 [Deefgea tanakiae]
MSSLRIENLPRVLWLVTFFSVIFTATVFSFYFFKFGRFELSNDLTHWAELGGYVGGLLTALLSLLSLLAVLFTVYVQSRLLERATKAQELSTDYSRLNGLIALQDYYLARCKFLQVEVERTPRNSSSYELFRQEWVDADIKLKEVNRKIEMFYEQLTS